MLYLFYYQSSAPAVDFYAIMNVLSDKSCLMLKYEDVLL